MRVAINGFGRIGRLTLRRLTQLRKADEGSEIEVVAINDVADTRVLAALLKFDSVHGRFGAPVDRVEDRLIVDGKAICVVHEPNPRKLPWSSLGVDVVIESSGRLLRRQARGRRGYDSHLVAGAKRVVLTTPAADGEIDLTVVMGVNDNQLSPEMTCISSASCTAHCAAPVAKVLHEAFGIESGFVTSVHAYTNEQRLLDAPHTDLYRARAAARNIVPMSSRAAHVVALVIPELKGKLAGMTIRVPVPVAGLVGLSVNFQSPATRDQINDAVRAAAKETLHGILRYTEDAMVSSDVVGDSPSSHFAGLCTRVTAGKHTFAQVVSWYDNEWAYCCRLADLLFKLAACSS